MSKLDEKLRASVKATRGKPTPPAKAVAAKPAVKPAPVPKMENKPTLAKAGSATVPGSTSALFPERIWPD